MKIDRFAVLLAGLLLVTGFLAAGLPAAGKGFRIGRVKVSVDSRSRLLAQAIALQVGEVQKRFADNRRALRAAQGADGRPAYLRQEVTGLITRTGEDLDQAIEKVQPSGTEPLRAWASEEIGRIQGEIPPPGATTASLPGSPAPRAVAVFASLRTFGLPMLAKGKPAPPKPKSAPPKAPPPRQPQTIPTGTADRLLDQVAEVVERIFVLASRNDLEVKLWVGSTPATKATFRFWPQGSFKGSTPSPTIIQTDGKRDHIVRGLYAYRATWGKGAVTQFIEYPNPAGPTVAGTASERLDLVKGSRFFCCQFNEAYCHHVDDEKGCR